MNHVQKCYDVTERLYEVVFSSFEEERREEVIKKIDNLLQNRESLLQGIKSPFTLEEKEMGRKILTWNVQIDQKLIELRNEIKKDMNNVNKKKSTAKKYNNPYESIQSDGFFYDKKN
jgi:flagellar protein FliT